MTSATETRTLSETQLRRWLTLLASPDRLADDEDLSQLLDAHGRRPTNGSAVDMGRAAATLLRDAIGALEPSEQVSRDERLPYDVLKTCFIDGSKLWQAADKLGISERQLTRERSRAIRLLRTELERPAPASPSHYRPEPIPAILGFLARPAPSHALQEALTEHRLVRVHGPAGVGKTSLVAEVAAESAGRMTGLWYRFRAGVNDSLQALLFELGEYLRSQRHTGLAVYMAESLPAVDTAFATRLALKGLSHSPHLLVLDDYHVVDEDLAIGGLLEEALARLPELRIILIGRHRNSRKQVGADLAVAPLTRAETRAFLALLGVVTDERMAATVHQWTEGVPQLVKLAASWLKTASPEEIADGEMGSLSNLEEVQAFFLDNITELMGPEERVVLEAASIFRSRFTDDALAFVAQRTRGEVQDTSRWLVRSYVATRGRNGDTAFFHNSVRDYIYDRLRPSQRAALHARAATWYQRHDDDSEAAWHGTAAARTNGV